MDTYTRAPTHSAKPNKSNKKKNHYRIGKDSACEPLDEQIIWLFSLY